MWRQARRSRKSAVLGRPKTKPIAEFAARGARSGSEGDAVRKKPRRPRCRFGLRCAAPKKALSLSRNYLPAEPLILQKGSCYAWSVTAVLRVVQAMNPAGSIPLRL